MESFVENGPGKADVHGASERDDRATATDPTAAEVERAWSDPKLANVLYHDWEATTYDEKWSISYDQRCIDYARDRFSRGRRHATAGRTPRRSSSAAAPASSCST